MTHVTPGKDWSDFAIDLATTCGSVATINEVTLHGGAAMSLLLDDIRFDR